MALLRQRRALPLLAAAALAFGACGGGSGADVTGPGFSCPAPPNGQITASINGSAYSATQLIIATIQNGTINGPNILQVSGLECPSSAGAAGRQVLITVGRLTPFTPGSYPLDPPTQAQGGYSGIGQVARGPSLWFSNLRDGATSGSGSITFTTITATRLVGSFQMSAVPAGSNASSDRQVQTVTSGAFDITVR